MWELGGASGEDWRGGVIRKRKGKEERNFPEREVSEARQRGMRWSDVWEEKAQEATLRAQTDGEMDGIEWKRQGNRDRNRDKEYNKMEENDLGSL